jgi:hypothetical protein
MALTVVKQMKDLISGSSGDNFLAECPYERSSDDDFPIYQAVILLSFCPVMTLYAFTYL